MESRTVVSNTTPMWKYILALLVLTSGGLYAAIVRTDENQARVEAVQIAKANFTGSDWAKSASAYEEVLRLSPNDREAHFRLALARHYQGRYNEAIEGFQRAANEGYYPSLCRYNIACGYAKLGDKVNALNHLEQALQIGALGVTEIRTDNDWKAFLSDPEFNRLLASYAKTRGKAGVKIIPSQDHP